MKLKRGDLVSYDINEGSIGIVVRAYITKYNAKGARFKTIDFERCDVHWIKFHEKDNIHKGKVMLNLPQCHILLKKTIKDSEDEVKER